MKRVYHLQVVVLLLLCFWATVPIAAAITLQGNVSQTALSPLTVQVEDADTHTPLPQATLQAPELHWQSRVNSQGQGTLPSPVRSQPLLLGVVAPGHQPLTLHLSATTRWPIRVGLKALQHSVVVGSNYYRVGDGAYSDLSAGAGQLNGNQWAASEPAIVQFLKVPLPVGALSAAKAGRRVWLRLGTVVGLDTADSQEAGQSQAPVSASPLQVMCNGQVVDEITLNGDGIAIALPPALLVGSSTIQVAFKAGYHLKQGHIVDYDDAGVFHVVLHWQ
jgi:hypothetical protein